MKGLKRLLATTVMALAVGVLSAGLAYASGGAGIVDVQAKNITLASVVNNVFDAKGDNKNCWFVNIEAEDSDLVLCRLTDGSGKDLLEPSVCQLTKNASGKYEGTMKFKIDGELTAKHQIIISSLDGSASASARPFRIFCSIPAGEGRTAVAYMNGVVAGSYTYVAEKTFYYNGVDYDLSKNAATSIEIKQGEERARYDVEYAVHQTSGGRYATIIYRAKDGSLIGVDDDPTPIKEEGLTTITVKDEITVNGIKYVKCAGQPSQYVVNNSSRMTDFVVYFRPENGSGYYTSVIKYQDADGKTLMPSKEIIVNGAQQVYYAPSTICFKDDSTGNLVYYSIALKDASVTLTVTPAVTEKVFVYSTFAGSGYNWYIRYIDTQTNLKIGEDVVAVNSGDSLTFDLNSEMTVGNAHYVLDSALNNSITHNFGDNRVSYVYYYPDGYVREQSYDITVNYYSVTDKKIFKTEKITVKPDKLTTVTVPEKIVVDGTGVTNVLLKGQNTSFEHNYYFSDATKRTTEYTIYYRDITDIQNEVTRVTTVDIISELFEDGGYTFTDNRQTILQNDVTDENTVIEDESTPLSPGTTTTAGDPNDKQDSSGIKVIDDSPIPLVAMLKELTTGQIILLSACGIALIVVIAAIIATEIKKRQASKNRRRVK